MGTPPSGPVHVGAGLPMSFDDPTTGPAGLAREAERLGYDSIWLSDPRLGRAGSLEPLTLLSFLAAVTERAALGISVVVTPQRIPVQLAQMLATVDQLSGGRTIAGLGIGRSDAATRAAYGVPPGRLAARYEEAIAVLRAAWSPGPLSHRGEAWTIDGVDVQPKPVGGQMPIWFGGNGDMAIDRAARLGDGWTGAGAAPWSGNAAYLETLRSALDRHGRDPAGFTIGKRIYLAVEPDRAKALRRLREVFGTEYGRSEIADTAAISGSVEQVRDELGRLVELGCRFLMVHPVYDVDEQLAIAAEQVVPELRQS